ncbi:MAG: aminotransferase class I/II-fold pyridoxal phosphate-dependent enzyme [Lachnospiraceae bacterium]
MNTLYDKLKLYSDSDYYAFHMPGHKRSNIMTACEEIPYGIDITEIEGFDDLHHAHGVLKDAQERAAKVYHADETHFLVNGSTVGIISAICGTTKKGDTILVARNCHKSVYHAIYLNELSPVYLYPGFDAHLNTEIEPQDVKDALEHHPEIRAVVIVSPTYDGVVSDVAAIAREVHAKGLPLIVDEAHGAHFGFHEVFPDNANTKGADIVIHSVHKTLPSLTQTALLHLNGTIVNRNKVRQYLDMLQTSSPSYVLMASIDACIDMLENRRDEIFSPYVQMLMETREKLGCLKHLKLIEHKSYDISKLVISAEDSDITSQELYQRLLLDYRLQMEMVAGTYVLAMTSVGDTKEGMERLTNALVSVDNEIGFADGKKDRRQMLRAPEQEVVYKVSMVQDVEDERRISVPWTDATGRIALEYAYLYPPGSPLIVPGERVSEETAELLNWYLEHGFSIEGLKKEKYIEVLINE